MVRKLPSRVGGHHVAPECQIGLVQRAPLGDTGIGDANLDRAAGGDGALRDFDHICFRAHIHGHAMQPCALRSDCVQHLLPASGDGYLRAGCGEVLRNGKPDARAAARYNRMCLGQIHFSAPL